MGIENLESLDCNLSRSVCGGGGGGGGNQKMRIHCLRLYLQSNVKTSFLLHVESMSVHILL